MSKFNITVTFRLEKDIHDKLERMLKVKNVKKSDFIREAIFAKMDNDVLLSLD